MAAAPAPRWVTFCRRPPASQRQCTRPEGRGRGRRRAGQGFKKGQWLSAAASANSRHASLRSKQHHMHAAAVNGRTLARRARGASTQAANMHTCSTPHHMRVCARATASALPLRSAATRCQGQPRWQHACALAQRQEQRQHASTQRNTRVQAHSITCAMQCGCARATARALPLRSAAALSRHRHEWQDACDDTHTQAAECWGPNARGCRNAADTSIRR